MNTGGFLFLIASWTIIIGLNLFCFTKLGRAEGERSRDHDQKS